MNKGILQKSYNNNKADDEIIMLHHHQQQLVQWQQQQLEAHQKKLQQQQKQQKQILFNNNTVYIPCINSTSLFPTTSYMSNFHNNNNNNNNQTKKQSSIIVVPPVVSPDTTVTTLNSSYYYQDRTATTTTTPTHLIINDPRLYKQNITTTMTLPQYYQPMLSSYTTIDHHHQLRVLQQQQEEEEATKLLLLQKEMLIRQLHQQQQQNLTMIPPLSTNDTTSSYRSSSSTTTTAYPSVTMSYVPDKSNNGRTIRGGTEATTVTKTHSFNDDNDDDDNNDTYCRFHKRSRTSVENKSSNTRDVPSGNIITPHSYQKAVIKSELFDNIEKQIQSKDKEEKEYVVKTVTKNQNEKIEEQQSITNKKRKRLLLLLQEEKKKNLEDDNTNQEQQQVQQQQQWMEMFQQLKQYKETSGHINVSKTDNPTLAKWVVEQRKLKRSSNNKSSNDDNDNPLLLLTEDIIRTKKRIELLDELGFVWTTTTTTTKKSNNFAYQNEKWMLMYQQLQEYNRIHGDCLVPRHYDDNRELGLWVNVQRKQYSLKQRGKKHFMTPEREKLLNEIGFVWNAQDASFDRWLSELKQFRNEHGHCLVPTNNKEYYGLAMWIRQLKKQYWGKTSTSLSKHRIDALNEIGFEWKSQNKTKWLERYNELITFKKKHGHLNVAYMGNSKLAIWVGEQRRFYRHYHHNQFKDEQEHDDEKADMFTKRYNMLKQIGFFF